MIERSPNVTIASWPSVGLASCHIRCIPQIARAPSLTDDGSSNCKSKLSDPFVAAQHATTPVMGEVAATSPPHLIAADLSAIDRWDAVPPPSPPNCSRRWEMVEAGPSSYDDDDLSIFHPSRHEGLHLQIQPRELIAVPEENPSHPPILGEEEWLHRWRRRLLLHVNFLIESGKDFIDSKLQSLREGGGGGGGPVWSFAALAGLLGFFLYLRRRHWREKAALLFLLQEKDQKITLLLQQIARMNEIIATRHGVPVPRT